MSTKVPGVNVAARERYLHVGLHADSPLPAAAVRAVGEDELFLAFDSVALGRGLASSRLDDAPRPPVAWGMNDAGLGHGTTEVAWAQVTPASAGGAIMQAAASVLSDALDTILEVEVSGVHVVTDVEDLVGLAAATEQRGASSAVSADVSRLTVDVSAHVSCTAADVERAVFSTGYFEHLRSAGRAAGTLDDLSGSWRVHADPALDPLGPPAHLAFRAEVAAVGLTMMIDTATIFLQALKDLGAHGPALVLVRTNR